MREKLQFYRPAAAAFLTMMAMSLTSSTLSFFLEPVCESLGINRGSFSVIFSLLAVSGAVTQPFLGRYAGKRGVRGILLLSGVWVCGSMLLMAAARQLWVLYLSGFLMGAFSTNCAAFCASVTVQQSYTPERAAGVQGIVMAGSGVGGMAFSFLIPGCIRAFGWEAGACAMGLSWLALHLAAAVLLGRETKKAVAGAASAEGITRAEALKSSELYLLMGIIIIVTACCGIQQQLPSLLSDFGYGPERVSVMISFMTAALAAGKIIQGQLYGRAGLKTGGCVMFMAFALGFFAMLRRELAWPGLVLLAFGMGIYTTMMPLVVRKIFGSREYPEIWALIATVGSVGTFAANPIWGTIFDVTGSYRVGLWAAPVLLAGATIALRRALIKTR